jgi:hypothetical protein
VLLLLLLLFLASESLLFFLLLPLQLSALARRSKHPAEGGRLRGLGHLGRGLDRRRCGRLGRFGLQGEGKLEVIEDDKLKLLANGCVLAEFKPSRLYAVDPVV